MARRYPVTTSVDPAPTKGGSSLWRAIAPATVGARFEASTSGRAYELPAPAAAFALTTYTLGFLYRQTVESPANQADQAGDSYLYQKGTTRYLYQNSGTNRYSVEVDGSAAESNEHVGGGGASDLGPSGQEGLTLDIIVVDSGAYSISNWYRNGRRQLAATTWSDDGSSTDAWQLGGPGGTQHLVGCFLHLDAMTFAEAIALQWNIQMAKDIPDVDYSGMGTVPDHIWSVKRAMTPGTNGVASWVSDGATGGLALARQDSSLVVIEMEAQLATLR